METDPKTTNRGIAMQHVCYITGPTGKVTHVTVRKRIDYARMAGEILVRNLMRSLARIDRPISNDAILWIRAWHQTDSPREFKILEYTIHTYTDLGTQDARLARKEAA